MFTSSCFITFSLLLIFADLMAGLKRLKLKRIGHDRFYRKFYFHNFSELRKNQFVTLLQVKKIAGNSKNAKAEWIWSDLFYWPNSELAEQRCISWYNRQPNPMIYLGNIVWFFKRKAE